MKQLFKIFFLIISLFLTKGSLAQMIVNDAMMLEYTVQQDLVEKEIQATNFIKEFNEIRTQTKILKEADESIKKVSNTLKNFSVLRTAINTQVEVYSLIQKDVKEIVNSNLNTKTVNIILNKYESILNNVDELTNTINTIFSNDFLKMNDYERLKMSSQINEKIQSLKKKVQNQKILNKKLINISEVYNQ